MKYEKRQYAVYSHIENSFATRLLSKTELQEMIDNLPHIKEGLVDGRLMVYKGKTKTFRWDALEDKNKVDFASILI